MEKIKTWKSYQKSLNRRKNKKNRFSFLTKIFFFIVILFFAVYGSARLFYYGKAYMSAHGPTDGGTGIRPILFKNGSSAVNSDAGFDTPADIGSLRSLKDYFRDNPPSFKTIVNGRYIQKIGNFTVVYTLNPAVQKKTEEIFKKYDVPFGVMAAVNPYTGAVLGLASYSSDKSEAGDISPLLSYPPGSLVKIITASAAIESKGFSLGSDICFNGGLYGTDKAFWKQGIDTGYNRISFKQAFASSCDIAFGKVAGYYVGRRLLNSYFDKFYFNKRLPFIINIDKSKAYVPKRFFQLELTGAGFKNVKVTPLQASLIAATALNGGKFIKPYLIREIISKTGKVVYEHRSVKVLDYPINPETSNILKQMMEATVTGGVVHADFYNRSGRYMLPGVTAGGKTGTISGDNPPGLYQWFAGFGEMNGKGIAVSALVIEKPVWRIEGGGVAENAIFAYFFNQNNQK